MEEELKNCPFCGGKAKKVWIPMQMAIPNVTVGGFAISCSDCYAVQLIGANNEQDAINQWNTRAGSLSTNDSTPEALPDYLS